MANKRQRKKQEKKQLVRQVAKSRNLTEKQAKKYSYNSLYSITQEDTKRQKRKDAKQRLRQRKKKAIENLGGNPYEFTLTQIDSLKVSDIESGNINSKNYPWLFDLIFDFNKVYKLGNNEEMYIAFRDFAGESSIEEILNQYSNMSNDRLLERLKELARLRPSYSKRSRSGSSGSAGDYKFMVGHKIEVFADINDSKNRNRRKKTRQHSGNFKGYQTIKNGHYNTFKEVTPRSMLIIANSIMENVTENDRVAFYQSFYYEMNKHIPQFGAMLPTPF